MIVKKTKTVVDQEEIQNGYPYSNTICAKQCLYFIATEANVYHMLHPVIIMSSFPSSVSNT